MVAVPVVRTQLGLCLRSIAQVDYPDNWPGLLSAICANMQQQNMERVRSHMHCTLCMYTAYAGLLAHGAVHGRAHRSSRSLALTLASKPRQVYGALFALRMLVKVYEFRQETGRAPLHAAVELRVEGAVLVVPPPPLATPAAWVAELRVWAALRAPEGCGRVTGRYRRQWQRVLLLPSSLCSRRSCCALAPAGGADMAADGAAGGDAHRHAERGGRRARAARDEGLLERHPDQPAAAAAAPRPARGVDAAAHRLARAAAAAGRARGPRGRRGLEAVEGEEARRADRPPAAAALRCTRARARALRAAPRAAHAPHVSPCALHAHLHLCPARPAPAAHPPILRSIRQATPSASATGRAPRRRPPSRSTSTTTG